MYVEPSRAKETKGMPVRAVAANGPSLGLPPDHRLVCAARQQDECDR
jgi:hypothetical protein